jgi:spoIIIJ-associated protein
MSKVAEGIGKNYDEAVEDALSKVGLTKEQVTIELIEEPKKRIFNILEHKQVKVKVVEKEEKETIKKEIKKEFSEAEVEEVRKRVYDYLEGIFKAMNLDLKISDKYDNGTINFEITGNNAGIIIGYRGDTLDALQLLATNAGNKGRTEYIRVVLDVENYRKKRVKALEELANRKAGIVIAKGRSITLEPMTPYERRIIHTTLQNHPKVKTSSTGEEPYRKVTISLK